MYKEQGNPKQRICRNTKETAKLGIDILECKETYILIGIYYFTIHAWRTALKSKNSRETANTLYAWLKKIRKPEEIIAAV